MAGYNLRGWSALVKVSCTSCIVAFVTPSTKSSILVTRSGTYLSEKARDHTTPAVVKISFYRKAVEVIDLYLFCSSQHTFSE